MPSETIAVTFEEGGPWVPFDQIKHKRPPDHFGWRVHSIKFDDGTVWDAFNGWRPYLRTGQYQADVTRRDTV